MDSSTGICHSCEEIHWGCETCDWSTQLCSECKYSYMILSPDSTECWNKLNNCELPLEAQNDTSMVDY